MTENDENNAFTEWLVTQSWSQHNQPGFGRIAWNARAALDISDELVKLCEELLSIETENTIGATWEKTNLESYETGDRLYRAEKTRSELISYKNQLKALTKYRSMKGE